MESRQKRLRVAAIGTGYFSQFHYEAWMRLDVDVVGICSLDMDEAVAIAALFEGCRAFNEINVMLDSTKPDLVDIITPPDSHMVLLKTCLDNGVPVICQKPFAQSLEQAKAVVALADEARVPIFVHENFRFQPWHMKIKELLDEGIVGEVYQASFRLRPGDGRGVDAYLNRQPYFQKMERFLVRETAIHVIDVFRYFFGELISANANLTRLNPQILGEDAGYIIMNFKSGARALFDGNRLSDHIAEDRRRTIGDLWIEGSEGTLRLNGDGQIFFRRFGKNNEEEIPFKWEKRGFAGDSVYRTQHQIIQHLNQGTSVANTAQDYLANLRAEEAIYRSNMTGRRIKII